MSLIKKAMEHRSLHNKRFSTGEKSNTVCNCEEPNSRKFWLLCDNAFGVFNTGKHWGLVDRDCFWSGKTWTWARWCCQTGSPQHNLLLRGHLNYLGLCHWNRNGRSYTRQETIFHYAGGRQSKKQNPTPSWTVCKHFRRWMPPTIQGISADVSSVLMSSSLV